VLPAYQCLKPDNSASLPMTQSNSGRSRNSGNGAADRSPTAGTTARWCIVVIKHLVARLTACLGTTSQYRHRAEGVLADYGLANRSVPMLAGDFPHSRLKATPVPVESLNTCVMVLIFSIILKIEIVNFITPTDGHICRAWNCLQPTTRNRDGSWFPTMARLSFSNLDDLDQKSTANPPSFCVQRKSEPLEKAWFGNPVSPSWGVLYSNCSCTRLRSVMSIGLFIDWQVQWCALHPVLQDSSVLTQFLLGLP